MPPAPSITTSDRAEVPATFHRESPFASGRPERDGPLWDEWVLTNSVGGFAMGTVLTVPTRRYHALLVAATEPPVGRVVALAQVADVLTLGEGEPHHLSLFHFEGADVRPEAHPNLAAFEKGTSCRWVYAFGADGGPEARVARTLHLHAGRNAVSVRYEVEAAGPWSLDLRPLLGLRDMHELGRIERDDAEEEDEIVSRAVTDEAGRAGLVSLRGGLGVHVACDAADYRPDPQPWRDLRYEWEVLRGQDDWTGDLHAPGVFEIRGDGPGVVTLTASTDAEPVLTIEQAEGERGDRLAALGEAVLAGCEDVAREDDRVLRTLAALSDDFVVERRFTRHDHQTETGEPVRGASIIAGYPWFTDWGRDTMICLPGLLLSTGRTDEALRTLATFGAHRRLGLIPNRFTDDGPAEYNTVDAPLWFVHACCEYVRVTGDRDAFERDLLPACAEVVNAYAGGTDYDIHSDPDDGLIAAGSADTQLTWMDAKRDGVTFTPRFGKAVEINALWHNALAALADAAEADHPDLATEWRTMSHRVARSFREAFLSGPAGGLIDCLTPDKDGGWIASHELRPNQIFAASLPHSPLEDHERARVVGVVGDHLLTPVGLRTLASEFPGEMVYAPRFEGGMMDRDAAYHNGTVWPWLIGPYAEAVLRVGGFSPDARREARDTLRPLIERLNIDVVGQLCEVYDADEPRRPDGCIAQAWSVAEPLRVWRMSLLPAE